LAKTPPPPSGAAPQEGEFSMYAVIKTGGKQYKVEKGDTLRVEKLAGSVGDAVTFDQVLLLAAAGESMKLGKPLVSGAKVEAKIVDQGLGKKLVVFKFRRRKNYRRKNGHRQPFTALEITNIVG
jgi:large subunit ribosomal protein L21